MIEFPVDERSIAIIRAKNMTAIPVRHGDEWFRYVINDVTRAKKNTFTKGKSFLFYSRHHSGNFNSAVAPPLPPPRGTRPPRANPGNANIPEANDRIFVVEGGRASNYLVGVSMFGGTYILTKDGQIVAVDNWRLERAVSPSINTHYRPFWRSVVYENSGKRLDNRIRKPKFGSVYGEIPERIWKKYIAVRTSANGTSSIFTYNR